MVRKSFCRLDTLPLRQATLVKKDCLRRTKERDGKGERDRKKEGRERRWAREKERLKGLEEHTQGTKER